MFIFFTVFRISFFIEINISVLVSFFNSLEIVSKNVFYSLVTRINSRSLHFLIIKLIINKRSGILTELVRFFLFIRILLFIEFSCFFVSVFFRSFINVHLSNLMNCLERTSFIFVISVKVFFVVFYIDFEEISSFCVLIWCVSFSIFCTWINEFYISFIVFLSFLRELTSIFRDCISKIRGLNVIDTMSAMSEFDRMFWVVFLDSNILIYEIDSVSIDFWNFDGVFSNSENSIPNERFFGILFDIERFSSSILFDRVVLFNVFEIVFFHIFDREKMRETKKENKETENSVLFFSIFWVQI